MRASHSRYHRLLCLLPGGLTLLFILFGGVPSRLSDGGTFIPQFALIAIFYWGLYRAQLMPYWFVFILGVVQDAIFATPLGMHSLLYLLFRLFVLRQRRVMARDTFMAIWMSFMLVSSVGMGLMWVMLSLYYFSALPFFPALMQWLVTIAVYPLAHLGFNMLYALLQGKSPFKVM